MSSNLFKDDMDRKVLEGLFDALEKEGVDIDNKKIKIISEDKINIIDANKAKEVVNKIIDFKNKIFDELDIDELTAQEFEEKLVEFHNSIKTDFNKSKIEKTKIKYSNINFDNLDPAIPNLILSGDNIYEETFKEFGSDWDYSPVMLQWCRAVELELRKKFYRYLNNDSAKQDISNKSMNSGNYSGKLMVDSMLGFYGAMKKYGMVEYIFNKYIKPRYKNININTFNQLIDYITKTNFYRHNSAHSKPIIDMNKKTADECKEYITNSKKILEILSHLERV